MAGRATRKTGAGTGTGRGTSRGKRQEAKVSPPAWNAERRAIFLEELSNTANVAASARAAGMPERSPYPERRKNEAFRIGWEEALDEGFMKLEMLLLERATFGDREPPEGEAKVGERQRAISTGLALSLLKLRQSRLKAKAPAQRPMRGAKLRDQLEARLAEINRRLGGEG